MIFSFCGRKGHEERWQDRALRENRKLHIMSCQWKYQCFVRNSQETTINVCNDEDGTVGLEAVDVSIAGENTLDVNHLFWILNAQKSESDSSTSFVINHGTYGYLREGNKEYLGKTIFSIAKINGKGKFLLNVPEITEEVFQKEIYCKKI